MSIHAHARGRVFRDAIPDGEDFRLRFMDGLELVCTWGSAGPEIKSFAHGVITQEMAIHRQFQYVSGKVVDSVWTDGTLLLIQFTDGHLLRSNFRLGGPEVEGVDVRVRVESPLAVMAAAGFMT